MKIRDYSRVTENSNIDTRRVKPGTSFNDSFSQINKVKTKEEVDTYIKQIKEIGKQLVSTKGYSDVIRYKQAIQKYLKSVVDYTYEIDKKDSFWSNNYFKTVNVVNEKLESLSRDFFNDEKENIDIASKIDDINGLLIDLYL
ncbi:MAG: YaaR family protein [Paraclostridium sp.]|uniref:YaaR family protein n=1 Tax=Paraclostridium sp. TaxID=2023273 RepID=UPI003F32EE0E